MSEDVLHARGTAVLRAKPEQHSPGAKQLKEKCWRMKEGVKWFITIRKERESHRGNNPINCTDLGSE